jgi:hypothetical protein
MISSSGNSCAAGACVKDSFTMKCASEQFCAMIAPASPASLIPN